MLTINDVWVGYGIGILIALGIIVLAGLIFKACDALARNKAKKGTRQMPITTFVTDAEYSVSSHPVINVWLADAEKALGKRIAIYEISRWHGHWWWKKGMRLFSAMVEVGNGDAQVINFAPREDSEWSINSYVPAQEVAAWLMGICTGASASKVTWTRTAR